MVMIFSIITFNLFRMDDKSHFRHEIVFLSPTMRFVTIKTGSNGEAVFSGLTVITLDWRPHRKSIWNKKRHFFENFQIHFSFPPVRVMKLELNF